MHSACTARYINTLIRIRGQQPHFSCCTCLAECVYFYRYYISFGQSLFLLSLKEERKRKASIQQHAFSASPHQFRNESSSPVAACPFYWIVSLKCSLQDVHLPRRTRSLLRLVRSVETESIKEKHNFVDFHHLSLIFRQFARADR